MAEASKRARERAEERRRALAAQQARESRRRLLFRVLIPVAVVIVVVAVLVIVKVAGGGSSASAGVVASGAAPAAVVTDVTTVPVAAFDAVGTGTVKALPAAIDADPLTADGKPRVLYVGAEYCPYCAAERWAMVAALARFGTFTGLQQTNSAAGDVYPNTATLSFHGATYTSDLLSFTGVETTTNVRQGNGYQPLDTLSAADEAIAEKYDAPPYVDSSGSIPFVDLGGKYLINGASYDPQLLQGKTHEQIAAALKDTGSAIAKGVLGTANAITAVLCSLTDNQPGAVCTSSGVRAATAKLGS